MEQRNGNTMEIKCGKVVIKRQVNRRWIFCFHWKTLPQNPFPPYVSVKHCSWGHFSCASVNVVSLVCLIYSNVQWLDYRLDGRLCGIWFQVGAKTFLLSTLSSRNSGPNPFSSTGHYGLCRGVKPILLLRRVPR